MQFKKIISFIIILILLFLPLSVNVKADVSDDDFSGTRSACYTIDQSDMSNFIQGGRSTFDYILRKSRPDWLTYNISTEGRNVELSISFDFSSYSDYYEKISALTASVPSIVMQSDDGLRYMENFTAADMLNFMTENLNASQCLNEKTLSELILVTDNTLSLNGEAYTSNSYIDIGADSEDVIKVDSLDISTTVSDDGIYSRIITVGINSDEAEKNDIRDMEKQLRKADAKVTTDDSSSTVIIEADISANNISQLSYKTMLALNIADSVTETESYKSDTTITVQATEYFDTGLLLRNEGSSFRFSCQYPESYKNVSLIDTEGNVQTVDGNFISVSNLQTISTSYETGLRFSNVNITTDLSSLSGKITRTISLSMRITIADDYYTKIKTALEDRLIDGVTLNIYDEGGSRYYEMVYSSWSMKDITNFTETMLNCNVSCDNNFSWMPYGTSSIDESFSLKKIISSMSVPEQVTVNYIFQHVAKVSSSSKNAANVTFSGNTITKDCGAKISTSIDYRGFYPIKNIVTVIGLVIIIVLIVIFVVNIKKASAARKKRKAARSVATKPVANTYLYVCPNCHAAYNELIMFCGNCGAKMTTDDASVTK